VKKGTTYSLKIKREGGSISLLEIKEVQRGREQRGTVLFPLKRDERRVLMTSKRRKGPPVDV